MRLYLFLILFLNCLISFNIVAQNDTINSKSQFNTKQKLIIGSIAALQVGSFYINYDWWWKDNLTKFKIDNSNGFNNYSLGVDHIGHFYTSYVTFNIVNELMLYGNFNESTRLTAAVIVPTIWALGIELGDGFSPYGLSYADFLGNSMGIAYGFAQQKVPYLKNFKFKMSYWPTPYYIGPNAPKWVLSEDYGGHFYWLSFNVSNIIPKSKKIWPRFLNVALGYGVNSFGPYATEEMKRKFGIGLDWNLTSKRSSNRTVQLAKEVLDYWHYPAPGVKFIDGQKTEFKALLLR